MASIPYPVENFFTLFTPVSATNAADTRCSLFAEQERNRGKNRGDYVSIETPCQKATYAVKSVPTCSMALSFGAG